MNKITKLRMRLAEGRLHDSAPKMCLRVREIKARFKSLYEMDEYDFDNLARRALALNVRDGHCHDMTERKEATDGND